MIPVEVVRSYQEIISHLLDEIHRLQMANIRLQGDVKNLQEYVPEPVPDAAREGKNRIEAVEAAADRPHANIGSGKATDYKTFHYRWAVLPAGREADAPRPPQDQPTMTKRTATQTSSSRSRPATRTPSRRRDRRSIPE